MDKRSTILKKASWVALSGNTVLASSKIIVGIVSGSLAVLSDGIDSATDVLIAAMTLFASRISSKPSDREHPYGHGRIETIVTTVISFVLFFAGAQILIKALSGLFSPISEAMPSPLAMWVTGVSVFGKLALSWSQFYYGKKSGSSMLIANAKNMRGDVITSVAVLLGLGLAHITGIARMDKILAALVAVWILKNALEIFLEANTELMDGTKNHEPYQDIFLAIAKVPAANNPHRVRLRRIGSMRIIDLDIEVDPSMTVLESHEIALQVENLIKESLPDVYDVIVHIEPFGNIEEEEKFGLTERDFDKKEKF